MGRRRRPGREAHFVPAQRQAQARRDRDLFLDHLQIARATRSRQRQGDGRQAADRHDGYQLAAVRCQADDLWRFRESREGVKQPYVRAAGPPPDVRPPSQQRISASADASGATIPSPSAGSLEMAAASNAPNAPPAICAKPSRAAATPALLPNGDRAAALDSGLAMPSPNKKKIGRASCRERV